MQAVYRKNMLFMVKNSKNLVNFQYNSVFLMIYVLFSNIRVHFMHYIDNLPLFLRLKVINTGNLRFKKLKNHKNQTAPAKSIKIMDKSAFDIWILL
jgi:hypothetical protein